MKGDPEERCVALGNYIARTGATVRTAAQHFGISKSTVHKDVTSRLARRDRLLFSAVQQVLQRNRAQRHLRGGMATRRKFHPDGDAGAPADA